jgi:hypothetical protein
VRTREPGGTEVGVLIRDIVLHHRGEVAPRAEALLYAADRAQHVATLVRPALARGDVVIQDRYLDSSVAYQGAGRVLDAEQVRDLSLWATEGRCRSHGAARPRPGVRAAPSRRGRQAVRPARGREERVPRARPRRRSRARARRRAPADELAAAVARDVLTGGGASPPSVRDRRLAARLA